MGILWDIFQPLLFGLIGAEVSIKYLNPDLVGNPFFHQIVLRTYIHYFLETPSLEILGFLSSLAQSSHLLFFMFGGKFYS